MHYPSTLHSGNGCVLSSQYSAQWSLVYALSQHFAQWILVCVITALCTVEFVSYYPSTLHSGMWCVLSLQYSAQWSLVYVLSQHFAQ